MPQGSKSATPRPVSAVKLKLTTIPKELKKLDRWILWKYTLIPTTGKWTKTPHSPANGHKIDATDLANGVSFISAVQALKKTGERFDGLGFLLGAGIAGIDVDDCIDENGNLDERGQRMSAAYKDTYAEVSPSGQGFKVLVNIGDDPKLAAIGKNTRETEVYGSKRYFTVTGAILPGHRGVVAEMADAFTKTAESVGAAPREISQLADMPAKRGLGIDMKAARELLDHLPFSWVDEYHDWLRAGMALHHEFGGDEEALELYDEWSQRSPRYQDGICAVKWQTFGKPGKDEVTLRTLVRDAQSTGWRAPRTVAQAIEDFGVFDEVPDVGSVDEDGVIATDWWTRYSVGGMLRSPAPAKRWVWQGVLRAGKLLVLAGSGGSSKSYLMLGAAVQYALGNTWGPFTMPEGEQPGRALLLYGEEDHEDVHDRVQALRHTFMLTDEQVTTVAERVAVLPLRGSNVELARYGPQQQDVVMTEQLAKLEQKIKEYGVQLLVFDPMALLHNLDENDNHAIASFVNGLDAVCIRTGAAIVLVHHFSKGGPVKAREVNESNVRGASSLVAHARTVVVMHRLREDEAAEWGVPEADHSRWVMWAIAKNNYGPSGRRAWFNVDERTGAISPSPTELVYLNSRDIRQAAMAHQEQVDRQDFEEMTATQERLAREAAEEEIQMQNRMRVLLRVAQNEGKLTTLAKAQAVLAHYSINVSPRRARAAIERIKNENLVDTDGKVSSAGIDWLEVREMLE